MEVIYQNIKTLLADYQIEGNQITCHFRIPGSDNIVKAQSTLRKIDSMKKQVLDSVKRNVMYEVRNVVYRLMRQALGSGSVGRIGGSAVSSVLSTQLNATTWSNEEKHAAIVEAFQTISSQFVHDISTQSWKQAGAMTEFDEQLLRHPINDKFEKDLLGRMLLQMASADQDFSLTEKEILAEQLGLSSLQIDELYLADHPILAIECQELPDGSKDTIYLLLYTIALVDNRLETKEKDRLDRFAQMLQFTPEKLNLLTSTAQRFVLDQAIARGTSWEELLELGNQIGIPQPDIERAWVHARRKELK